MSDAGIWTDLLDPSAEELEAAAPTELQHFASEQLALRPEEEPGRPALDSHGTYIFAALYVPVAVPEEDRLYYQEIDVVLTSDRVLTVRKTPAAGDPPFDADELKRACEARGAGPAEILYRLLDLVGERYVELIDDLDGEVDELEDGIDEWASQRVRRRIQDLRHAMLHVRQTLAPTRDAVRRIVDGRLQLGDSEAFDQGDRIRFGDAYDKLLRASEGLDVARELLSSARDYHQSKIAEAQNDIVKKLTVIASLLLVPTLIVGIYGQNFHHIPELHWRLGYAFSWALILGSTVIQLAFFRWRRWL